MLPKHDLIELRSHSGDSERTFGSKARAFNPGLKSTENVSHEFVGNLDADISFGPSYYEDILLKFRENHKLGIAGGVRNELVRGKFVKIRRARNSVAGAFQLFRRKCLEDIGGYVPSSYGGIDTIAEIMARKHG